MFRSKNNIPALRRDFFTGNVALILQEMIPETAHL